MVTEIIAYFITWNTYGTWIPGDARGWRKRVQGEMLSRPLLETWCKDRLIHAPVILQPHDRQTVQDACREHCTRRDWKLLAVNARTNHVHLVVSAFEKLVTVRDQLKANCTRRLRIQEKPLSVAKTWSTGGDCEVIDNDDDLETVIRYVLEAQ